MKDLIESLKTTLLDKALSPEQASGYIGCSGNQIRRWFRGTSRPTPLYREAILRGIEKIKREAI
jgi:hypothetical protein